MQNTVMNASSQDNVQSTSISLKHSLLGNKSDAVPFHWM